MSHSSESYTRYLVTCSLWGGYSSFPVLRNAEEAFLSLANEDALLVGAKRVNAKEVTVQLVERYFDATVASARTTVLRSSTFTTL